MLIKPRLERLQRNLHRAPTKLQGLFKVTDFDRLLNNISQIPNDKTNKKQFSLESIVKSGLIRSLLQIPSQRQFVKILEYSSIWQRTCELSSSIPHQSTFSRYWNDENILSILERLFQSYQALIPLRRFRQDLQTTNQVFSLFKMGYQVIVIDSTMINLSQKRFKYATYRITRPRGLRNVGAKINLSIDSFQAFPLHYRPTQAHEHDSKHMDSFVEKLITERKNWFKSSTKRQLKPLLIFDKGYWKEERFWRWSQENIFFLCPKRQRTFTRAQFEILDFPKSPNKPLDVYIWRESHSFPLRWIIKLESSALIKRWEVVTNNLEIGANRIFQLYSHRWPIEEVFKWLKQHLCLEKPTTNSWNGFLIHLYFVLLLFLLLLLFLFLIGCQRWQNYLTDLWLQLRFSPLEPWWIHKLKSSFAAY